MTTPSIQTLITQAQQVLNLKSTNEIRATLAAVLANANVGTPLNPSLTTQQLWDEFYEIVRQPSDDIMSIITDQMMRMVFSPPAPGGAGADKQVIFNDMGVLAGDAGLTYNKATDALTITGDLTVDTSTLKVDSTNDNVIVGATSAIGGGRFSVQADLSAKQGICVKNSAASYGSSNNLIRFTNSSDATIGAITHPAVTSLGIWGVTETQFFLGAGATTAMTLNSTGLGIGIAPDSAKATRLSVYQTGDLTDETAPFSIGNTAGNGMRLYAGVNNTNEYVYIGSVKSTTGYRSLILQPNGGNVGVGTTSPFSDAGYKSIDLRGTTGGEVVLGSTSVREATITGDGTNGMTLNTINATPLRFFTQGVERARFNTAGNLAFVSGKGIDFAAVTGGTGTATANVLNDYEEGTFTATLKGGTTDPTIAVTTTGKYTKIGNQVFVRIMFGNVSTLGASGAISITGLPFTSATTPEQIGYLMVENMATFTNSSLSSYLGASSTTMSLYTSTSNSAITAITHSAGIGRYLWAAITYTAA